MKRTDFKRVFSRVFSAFLVLVTVLCSLPALPLFISAQNVTGTMYASLIRENEAVVLWGDTTLIMDTDLTVPSITGDYDLTGYGNGLRTVIHRTASSANAPTNAELRPNHFAIQSIS